MKVPTILYSGLRENFSGWSSGDFNTGIWTSPEKENEIMDFYGRNKTYLEIFIPDSDYSVLDLSMYDTDEYPDDEDMSDFIRDLGVGDLSEYTDSYQEGELAIFNVMRYAIKTNFEELSENYDFLKIKENGFITYFIFDPSRFKYKLLETMLTSPLQKILENINSTLNNPIDVKLPNMFKPTGEKRKSASGIDGKYFKSQDNVSGSMISQQDREKSTPEGRAKEDLDKSTTGDVRIFSSKEFDEMLNKSGDRSLNLSDGQEKALNSKKANYLVKRLPDGRVRVRKVKEDQTKS